jgi:hypothetical protein
MDRMSSKSLKHPAAKCPQVVASQRVPGIVVPKVPAIAAKPELPPSINMNEQQYGDEPLPYNDDELDRLLRERDERLYGDDEQF